MVDSKTIKHTKTKIAKGKFHFKKKRYCFINDKVTPVKFLSGELRVIYNHGTTYVVIPICSNKYQGIMIPIVEDYDSLEEIK